MNIKVFGAANCAGCVTVKDILETKGIGFEYLDVNSVVNYEEAMAYGVRSIPTVVVERGGVEHFFTGASKPTIDSILLHIEGDKV
jgi:glutaredoxin